MEEKHKKVVADNKRRKKTMKTRRDRERSTKEDVDYKMKLFNSGKAPAHIVAWAMEMRLKSLKR